MPQGGARGQNLGHFKKSFFFLLLFFSYVINHQEQVLFRVDFLPVTSDSRVFFSFLSFAESFVVEQQTLFWVDLIHISMISDVKVQC